MRSLESAQTIYRKARILMFRGIARLAAVLLLTPLAAFAQNFDAVDTLFPSSAGQFLA